MAFFSPWKLSSQKLGFFLVTFGFIWGMMLLHFTIQQRTQPESSSMLREQILDLSKRYIKALAEENRDVVDGPYAGVMTAYDLKKTLAVLLDNILQRIGKLESKVDNLVNGTGANSTNSTTAVPSLVSLEKINVADAKACSMLVNLVWTWTPAIPACESGGHGAAQGHPQLLPESEPLPGWKRKLKRGRAKAGRIFTDDEISLMEFRKNVYCLLWMATPTARGKSSG